MYIFQAMRFLLLLLVSSFPAFCQDSLGLVSFSLDSASVKSFRTDTVSEIRFIVSVKPGYHLFANGIKTEYLIPTRLEIEKAEGLSILEIRYPQGTEKVFFDIKERMYEGVFAIPVMARVRSGNEFSLAAVLKYQACNDRMCLPPAEKKAVFERKKGFFAAFLFLFLGGLLLNLTPCVYPVIPITLSFFAGQARMSKLKTAFFAGCYVLGIAFTYSLLGTLAALSGGLMGSALQHPAVLWAIVLLFIILSLSMFGLYEIRVPQFMSSLGVGRKGPAGALMMGLIVGIVAAPCVGPVTAGLLLHVAEKRDALYGFLNFFFLSLGLGAPYFALAFFSASLRALPGSGGWMVWVRKFFGFVLLMLALYYTRPLLPLWLTRALALATALAGAFYLGFLEKSALGRFPGFIRFQRVFGICVLAVSIIYFTWEREKGAAPVPRHAAITVEESARLRASGVPFVLDFRADWCAPCRRFEETVLTTARVREALSRVSLYTVDVTRSDDFAARAMADSFRVVGVPTLIFMAADGREAERVTEYIEAEAFLNLLDGITPKEDK